MTAHLYMCYIAYYLCRIVSLTRMCTHISLRQYAPIVSAVGNCYRLCRRNIRAPLDSSKIIDHTMPCRAANRRDSLLEFL